MIEKEWASKTDVNDDESMAWLLLDIASEMFEFDTASYEYFIEFEMKDDEGNTVWYENLSRTEKEKLIEDLLK